MNVLVAKHETTKTTERHLRQVQLEGHEGEGADPVQEVRDDLHRGRSASVTEKGTHERPELVLVRGLVADVP